MAEESHSKRLIRDRKTGKFLAGHGWTENADEAVHYDSIPHAIRAFLKFDLLSVELVSFPGNVSDTSVADLRAAQSNWADGYKRNH